MAYATVGLVKSGHYAEAKAALAYELQANVGAYESYLTGDDGMRASPTRSRSAATTATGPSGATRTPTVRTSSSTASASSSGRSTSTWPPRATPRCSRRTGRRPSSPRWPTSSSTCRTRTGSSPPTPPSGRCTGTASSGTSRTRRRRRPTACAPRRASRRLAGDTASSATYLTHGQMARDALIVSLRGPGGALGQSTEAIASGTAWLDASVIEAINWGLIDPNGPTAQATMSAMQANLLVADGEGFMRDQTGGSYDSQEWVFVDLRVGARLRLGGNSAFSTNLFAWNTQQSADNFGEISELYSPTTGDYEGSPPMVGFGAGAYILTLAERGTAVTPSCGAFAAEPGVSDGGAGGDAGGDGGGASRRRWLAGQRRRRRCDGHVGRRRWRAGRGGRLRVRWQRSPPGRGRRGHIIGRGAGAASLAGHRPVVGGRRSSCSRGSWPRAAGSDVSRELPHTRAARPRCRRCSPSSAQAVSR